MTAFVETRHLAAMRLIGIPEDFIGLMGSEPNGDEVIPDMWGNLFDQLEQVEEFEFGWAVGVMSPSKADNPKPGQLEYFAGLVVDYPPDDHPGLQVREIEASDYLVCEHLGSLEELADTTRWFYTEYLPSAGYVAKDAPHLEVYDERFDPESHESVVMICVPIAGQSGI